MAMLVSSLISGYISDKVNLRWPFFAGIPLSFFGLYLSSLMTLDTDIVHIIKSGMMVGFGVGFIIVPISISVFSTVKAKDMANASILNSYLSVLSGGVSMAIAVAVLMSRVDVNTAYFTGAIRHDNPVLGDATSYLGAETALPLIFAQVQRQAVMLSFNDVLCLMSIFTLTLLLYLPFMKRAKSEYELTGAM